MMGIFMAVNNLALGLWSPPSPRSARDWIKIGVSAADHVQY